jgi:cytoskeletal protein CcmA (bactofilin family)
MIVINVDVMLARRKMSVTELTERVGLTMANVSLIKNGKVKANIKAREVSILGSVHGDVEAVDKIAIREQGSLVGNIKTAGISIDDGAYFKGSIDIVRPEPKVVKKPEVNVKAQAS